MAISIYVAGPVDNTPDRSYYDIVYSMLPEDVPVTLFCPGRAFKVRGGIEPEYIVDTNKAAMLGADIVLFYITDVYTCGVWCEVMMNHYERPGDNRRYILYAAPEVRIGVYMKWIAKIFRTEWINNHDELKMKMGHVIHSVHSWGDNLFWEAK